MVHERNPQSPPHTSSNDNLLELEHNRPGSSGSIGENCSVSEEEDELRGPNELPYGEEGYSPLDITHRVSEHALSSNTGSPLYAEHTHIGVFHHLGKNIHSKHLEKTGRSESYTTGEPSSSQSESSRRHEEPQRQTVESESMADTNKDDQMYSYQTPSQFISHIEGERLPDVVPEKTDNSESEKQHNLIIENLTAEEKRDNVCKKSSQRQLSPIPERDLDANKGVIIDSLTSRDQTTGWFTPSENRSTQHDTYSPFSDEQKMAPVPSIEEVDPLSIPNTQKWQNQGIGLAISPGTSHVDLNRTRNRMTDERRRSTDSLHSPTHIPVRKNLQPVPNVVPLSSGSERLNTFSAADLAGPDSIHLDQKKDTFPPNLISKKDQMSFGQTSTFAPTTSEQSPIDGIAPPVQGDKVIRSKLSFASGYTPPSDHDAPRERARHGGKALAAEDEHDHDQHARRMTISVHQVEPGNNLSRHATTKSNNSGELEDEAESGVAKSQMLGDVSTIALVVDQILGSAIFATPAIIMATVQSAKTTLIVWALASLQAITGAMLYQYLNFHTTRSGGELVFLKMFYGRKLIQSWFAAHFMSFANTAGNVILASTLLNISMAPPDIEDLNSCHDSNSKIVPDIVVKFIGIGILLLLSGIHYYRKMFGVRLNNTIACFKVGVLLFAVSTAIQALHGRCTDPRHTESCATSLSNTLNNDGLSNSTSPADVAIGMLAAKYTFRGWENASFVAREIQRPKRTPYTVLIAITVISICYLIVVLGTMMVVSPIEMTCTGVPLNTAAYVFFQRVLDPSDPQRFRYTIPIVLGISSIGSVSGGIFIVSREIAKECLIPAPRRFAHSIQSANNNTPRATIVLNFCLSSIVVLAMPRVQGYEIEVYLLIYPHCFFAVLIAFGFLRQQWKENSIKTMTTMKWIVSIATVINGLLNLYPLLLSLGFIQKSVWGIPGLAVVGIGIGTTLVGGSLYWWVLFVFMPWWRGFTIRSEVQGWHAPNEGYQESVKFSAMFNGGNKQYSMVENVTDHDDIPREIADAAIEHWQYRKWHVRIFLAPRKLLKVHKMEVDGSWSDGELMDEFNKVISKSLGYFSMKNVKCIRCVKMQGTKVKATEDWLFDIPTDYLRYLLSHPFAAGGGRGHTARYMYEVMVRAHTDSIHKSGYIVELQWSKEIIMWGSMIPLLFCFLLSVLWSILENDVNTGFGLGGFFLSCAAFFAGAIAIVLSVPG